MRELISDLLKRYVLPYAKAYVPVVLGLLWGVFANFGLEVPVEVQTSVTGALVAFVVWLVPNIPYVRK